MENKKIFNALIVRKTKNKKISYDVEETDIKILPDNDVLIRVYYSSINYKDVLSCQGNLAITRKYPHIPGIDAAGVVLESKDHNWKPGDEVIALSHDLGMNTFGGFGQLIRVPGDWLLKLPKGMSMYECMAIGTAGYTAALAVNIIKENKDILVSDNIAVTGATGGVGSLSILFLNKLGFKTSAITRSLKFKNKLFKIGTNTIIDHDKFVNKTNRNLLPEIYKASIDVAGGDTLTSLIRSTKIGGIVLSVGNAKSPNITLSILPFILRNVSLIGVNADSNLSSKTKIWKELSNLINKNQFKDISTLVKLDELPSTLISRKHLEVFGRIVVKMH